ncbi:beta-1,4 N-acetylgalactosaminyltransferase 1-like isoform X2 [Xiphophorus hellerii]|nr:beta-1,4 N-acetylgalactosaminyltransferase 1-like isoform X2 [Xiphophorus hellerii]XP_032406244.1 beta-1,4 N-acetylgalactosaminyltransferase 1-like isoform X2 [Xiphophorus hellerii]
MWYLRKTVLLAILVSVVLVLVLLHSWSTCAYNTVDLWQRLGATKERHLEERLPEPDTRLSSVPFQIRKSVSDLLEHNGCVCEAETPVENLHFDQLLFPKLPAHSLHTASNTSELGKMKMRRAKEYKAFQQRSKTAADTLIITKANNPLQYPTQGVEVRPLKTIIIPGLALHDLPRDHYTINITATLGTLNVEAEVEGVKIKGDGGMHMSLSSSLLLNLNRQLQFVTYTNTKYHPNTADTVELETEGHQAAFSIKIRHGVTPKLYNTGPQEEYNVSKFVTIATKTFLRYEKLQKLIDSIRKYYPTVTIVIADDSDNPKTISGPYIEQYIMPFGKGWFAGRNLAVSQVTTKYVLWVDDDFLFTANTKLEKLVDVLERTTLDLVGGAVDGGTFRQTMSIEPGEDDGDCLHIRRGFHHVIEGFPHCVVTDGVINFFLAHTDKVRQVGFDPRLNRVAHIEFFIDGLGSLYIGSCDDITIDHQPKVNQPPASQTYNENMYNMFRNPSTFSDSQNIKYGLMYFKNRLQCQTRN